MEQVLKVCFNHMNDCQHCVPLRLTRILSCKIQQNVESTHRHQDPKFQLLRGFHPFAEPQRFNCSDTGLLKCTSILGCLTPGMKSTALHHGPRLPRHLKEERSIRERTPGSWCAEQGASQGFGGIKTPN